MSARCRIWMRRWRAPAHRATRPKCRGNTRTSNRISAARYGSRVNESGTWNDLHHPMGIVSEAGASIGEVMALHQRIAEQADTIRDLRHQRDADAEERRRLTLVLADRTSPPAAPKRAWWPWRR